MQKVLTAEEMREVDRLTTEKYGIPSLILMENAAQAAARVIAGKLGGSVAGKRVLILCGKGNNGGDGAALARILWTQGAWVDIYLVGQVKDTKGDARVNFEILDQLIESNNNFDRLSFFEDAKAKEFDFLLYEDVIVDALIGTGLKGETKGEVRKFIIGLKKARPDAKSSLWISLDIPSGLQSDLFSYADVYVGPDSTITFTSPKPANLLSANGELIVANIGSPQELIDACPSKVFVAEKHDAKYWLGNSRVHPTSYKKTRGTALIIAGSENYSGAAVLAANACFAAGAGMVTAAVGKDIHQLVAAKTLPEVIVKPLENIDLAKEKVDVVAIGCGLSNDDATHKFIRRTVENRRTPVVLDAEALNALAPFGLRGSDGFPLILTPHIGEFSRLLGREVREDRIAEVREFAEKHNVILVLKGERSLIGRPDGTVVINPTGNAGVSRAGAGDTLAGIITSFIAQTMQFRAATTDLLDEIFKSVVAALYVAGLAGDIAAERFSERLMTATDVRECLQAAIESIEN